MRTWGDRPGVENKKNALQFTAELLGVVFFSGTAAGLARLLFFLFLFNAHTALRILNEVKKRGRKQRVIC